MTNRQLRKLSRKELLELLIEQGKELDQMQQELDRANEKLKERNIVMQESGSIAEAVLKLNHVFEAAQNAADQYLESVKATEKIRENAEAEAAAILRDAEEQRGAMLEKTKRECLALVSKVWNEYRQGKSGDAPLQDNT